MSLHTTVADQLETAFEKRRGISRLEIRDNLAQIHISQLDGNLADARLEVLKLVADANFSIDFVKLTPSGFSFLVDGSMATQLDDLLKQGGVHFSIAPRQSIVLVTAVNMRDEEGLLARVVSLAIATGAPIAHLADMHDQLLVVTDHDGARTIADRLKQLMEEQLEG
ncbi:MAG: hypothetical protein JNJ45_02150 [Chthonomonas sp.]|nr:hypothetical protein [Chthonomonas sp.]